MESPGGRSSTAHPVPLALNRAWRVGDPWFWDRRTTSPHGRPGDHGCRQATKPGPRGCGGYIWPVRVLRIGLRVSWALVALGILGGVVGSGTWTPLCPAGCAKLAVPLGASGLSGAVFAAGVIGAMAFNVAIVVRQWVRQSANAPRPQPVLTDINPAADPEVSVVGRAVAQFRPMELDIRKNIVPTSSNLPWMQRFTIRPEGLEMRNGFSRAWVPRDRITGLYLMPGAIRVVWDGGDGAATVSDWRIKEIAGAMERAGYRFDPD